MNALNTEKPGLKMKKLVDATGVPKSTILHYLSQGLLPAPVRTGPNMAYYDPQCIDRIKLIRHLQNNHRLSLSEIGKFFSDSDAGKDFSMMIELNNLIFGIPEKKETISTEDFLENTGLTTKQLNELLDARLLNPLEKGRFDMEDVAMAEMYARGFDRGIRVEDITYYVEAGEKIVDREMALRNKITNSLPENDDAAVTIEMVKNARMSRSYVIDRLFQHRVANMPGLKDKPSTN